MRNVVSSKEVPHLWAHQTQPQARGGNIFFEGETIYSYGRHFPIARHVTNAKGRKAILFTTGSYSVTTAKHISHVRRALDGNVPVFYVARPELTPSEAQFVEYQSDINKAFVKAQKARNYLSTHLNTIHSTNETSKEFAKFFGIKAKVKMPSAKILKALQEKAETMLATQAAKKAEREAAEVSRQATLREKCAENLILWKAGHKVELPYLPEAYGRIEENEIVTTHGARIPIEHAQKAAPLVRKLIESGKTYQRNGHSIYLGHYVIEYIDAQGNLKVGCHFFERAEVLRILDLV